MLSKGVASNSYIAGITNLMRSRTQNYPLKHSVFKTIHEMPSLVLQNLTKASKLKHDLRALERKIVLWKFDCID